MTGVAWLLQPRRGSSMANFLVKAALPLGQDPRALDVAVVGQAAPHDHYTLRCVDDTRPRLPSFSQPSTAHWSANCPMPDPWLWSSGRVAPTPCKPPAPPTTCSICSASAAPAPLPSAAPSWCPVSSRRMPLCHRQTRGPLQLQLQLQAPPQPRAPSPEPRPPPPRHSSRP